MSFLLIIIHADCCWLRDDAWPGVRCALLKCVRGNLSSFARRFVLCNRRHEGVRPPRRTCALNYKTIMESMLDAKVCDLCRPSEFRCAGYCCDTNIESSGICSNNIRDESDRINTKQQNTRSKKRHTNNSHTDAFASHLFIGGVSVFN